MKLYLAGPMSNIPELNFPLFHAETARLRGLGYEIINPAEVNADPAVGWLACMRDDIAALVRCDGVATLPGWENSRGAKIERGLAESLGLVVLNAEQITKPAGAWI
jgi:hypothetical protein